jgi:hypothetical protein
LVATEQVERSPAERRCFPGPAAIKEVADILDEGVPAAQWHVTRSAIGIKPGEALRPGARDVAVMLDNRRAFFFGLAPDCQGVILRQRRRGRFFPLFKLWQRIVARLV